MLALSWIFLLTFLDSQWAVYVIKQQTVTLIVPNLTLDHFTNPAQNWYTSKSSDCAEVNHILLPCWEKAEGAVKWRSAQVWSRSVWEWRRFSSALVRGIYEAHWCECKTLRAAPQLASAFTSTRVYSEPKPSCRHSSLTLLTLLTCYIQRVHMDPLPYTWG